MSEEEIQSADDLAYTGNFQVTLHRNAFTRDLPPTVQIDGRILTITQGQLTRQGRLLCFTTEDGSEFQYSSGFVMQIDDLEGTNIWTNHS